MINSILLKVTETGYDHGPHLNKPPAFWRHAVQTCNRGKTYFSEKILQSWLTCDKWGGGIECIAYMKWQSPVSSTMRRSKGGFPSSSSFKKRWRPVLLNIQWITRPATFSKEETPNRNGTWKQIPKLCLIP